MACSSSGYFADSKSVKVDMNAKYVRMTQLVLLVDVRQLRRVWVGPAGH